jgi:hypothetical protein
MVGMTAALVLAWATTAEAAVVSGGITDPKGDGSHSNDVRPWDLAGFTLTYDDAGSLTASYTIHDVGGVYWLPYHVVGKVGVWRPSSGTCDVTSTGGLSLDLNPNIDAPVPYSWLSYAVAGHNGGASQTVETVATAIPGGHRFTHRDVAAFAQRGYGCVTDVALEGGAGALDAADTKVFCLGPAGTTPCAAPPRPIQIKWASPRDGQTVSGVLREGPRRCWAESTGPIVRTENWVDGRFHDAQATYPWGCEIDTRRLSNGIHRLTVKAFAGDGRSVQNTVRIRVAN